MRQKVDYVWYYGQYRVFFVYFSCYSDEETVQKETQVNDHQGTASNFYYENEIIWE